MYFIFELIIVVRIKIGGSNGIKKATINKRRK